MSILPVFGENLRMLCKHRDSIAGVSRDLGINRVQFTRFLNGESFPKPNVLKIICDHFGVDARVLTERLSPQQLDIVNAGRGMTPLDLPNMGAAEALNFVRPNSSIFETDPDVPDGLYGFYRRSPSFSDKVMVHILQVKSLAHCRVIRGYQHRQTSQRLGDPVTPAGREFRGVIMRQRQGFAALLIHADPESIISQYYFTPAAAGLNRFQGLSMLCREQLPYAPRLSMAVFEHLDSSRMSILEFARKRPLLDQEELPQYIRDIVLSPRHKWGQSLAPLSAKAETPAK